MSTVELAAIKRLLRVIHSADDVLLQELIDRAEDEALQILNRTQPPTLPLDYPPEYDSSSSEISEDVPSSDDPAAASFQKAVCILVQADYEIPDPDKQAKMRANAETVLMPYRARVGV